MTGRPARRPERLARGLRAGLLMLSLLATLWAGAQIAANPLLTPVRDRTEAGIRAALDRALARGLTPGALAARITARLDATPRNWIAIGALFDLAAERQIDLPPDLTVRADALRAADTGLLASAADCAACAYDPGLCSLSNVAICGLPVALTPIGDIAGLARAGAAYVADTPVDRLDLGLSLIGLGATAAVVATGGSSALVKAGAGTARLARRMDLLSPHLLAMAGDALHRGIDWGALPAARSADDLARLIRADALAPLIDTLSHLERMQSAIGPTRTLHLLPLIDDATEARHLARAAEAVGPGVIGRAEVLGKVRLLRAATRIGDVALTLIGGLVASLVLLAQIAGALLQRAILALVRQVTAMGPVR